MHEFDLSAAAAKIGFFPTRLQGLLLSNISQSKQQSKQGNLEARHLVGKESQHSSLSFLPIVI
jgi:hypothetical protein